jgi:Tfp pilus assembly protein FimV
MSPKDCGPQGLTILQTMDALYSQNSNAFVDGDANNIKKGAILRLPTETDISLEEGSVVASQIGLNGPDQAVQSAPKGQTLTQEPELAVEDELFPRGRAISRR